MFDKLNLRTDHAVCTESTYKQLKQVSFDVCIKPDRYYSLALSFDLGGGRTIVIKQKPRMPNMKALAIELNPSKFQKFELVKEVLQIVCPLDKLEITRIDHCVDVELPIITVYSMAYAKFKNTRSDYRGKEFTGFELGCNNEKFCIYDKAYQLKEKKKYRLINQNERGIRTRVELRQLGKKIKFRALAQIHKYIDDQPFTNLRFFELVPPENVKNPANFMKLQTEIARLGLMGARKALDASHNFNRTYGPFLIESTLGHELVALYKKNLSNFFNMSQGGTTHEGPRES